MRHIYPFGLLIFFLAICTPTSAFALETGPLQILRIIDGDSIVVEGSAGGVAVPMSVRLRYLDTPEMREQKKYNPHGQMAKDCLKKILTPLSTVILFTHGEKFTADTHGRVLAIVWVIDSDGNRQCLQEYMIAAGMSVYWQRFGKAGAQFHAQWQAVERSAELHANGLWLRQRTWMLSKRAEGKKR